MSKFNDLVTKLREVFQIDRPDLDFGIYRIMNARADQITRYLEHDLREKVSSALSAAGKSDTEERLAGLRKELEGFFTPAAFADNGTLTDDNALATAKGKEYHDLHSKFLIQNSQLDAGPEDQVYSHLLTFFSRYYEKGDYISKRRYKGDTYAIPYSGEEVVLHWANKDQYYIKSGEAFTNYSFKLPDGRRVSFQLLAADTAKDNRKDNDENRLFALIPEGYSLTRTDEDGEEITATYEPITEDDGDLILHFTYQGYPKSVKKKDKNAETLKRILAHPLVTDSWRDLHSRKPTGKNKDRTLLEYHLTTYTEKNSSDYFIHKDLGRFLRNELDFYIKNEVMHLDDVQNADTFDAIKDQLRLIQTLREIALDLIRFLAQLEDFQKKLWLKKKFVTQVDYCLTLDRIPEKLYPEIATNEAQHEEWIKLYAIDEIEAQEGDLAQEDTAGYSTPLTVAFLNQNPFLVLDTTHFTEEFKAQLLDTIPNLDESLDGLLIDSENFQALNLLNERYREEIRCVYIDPPYNTEASPIDYKNGYRKSSWATLIDNRVDLTKPLMKKNGILCATIDDFQQQDLNGILKNSFGSENIAGTVVLRSNPSGRPTPTGFSLAHEYAIFCSKNRTKISKLPRSEAQARRYNLKDEEGPYMWELFRKRGSESLREDRATQYYPFYASTEGLRIPEMKWNKSTRLYEIEEEPREDETIAWPIDEEGTERRWRWSKERVLKDLSQFKFEKNGNEITIYYKYRPKSNGVTPTTNWIDSKYSATEHGTGTLKALFTKNPFSYPKSIHAVHDCIKVMENDNATITLDYFAGSGTTGHAIINLNRTDQGVRKYILVELGKHFDTVLKPRLKKVAYSANWKDGKPTTRDTGISHAFKYLRLESYEDVLNNLHLPKDESDLLDTTMGEDYQLGYMLDVEARASLLSVADFQKPFDYQLKIATDSSGASEPRTIDLVETFNYLIGLTVEHYDRNLARGYTKITGTLPTGEKTLILWRDCEKIGYEELDELCKKWDISPRQKEYDLVYLNGDHNLPNVLQDLEKDGGSTRELRLRQIEPEFLSRMFEEN